MPSRTIVAACLLVLTATSPALASYGWWGTRAPNVANVRSIRQGATRLVAEGGTPQETSDGRTWRELPPIDGRPIAVTALSGDVLYAATSRGVYRRLGPSVWRRSQQGLPDWLHISDLAADSGGTLAGLVEPARSGPDPEPLSVFRSLDEGLTWTQTTGRFAEEPRSIVAGRVPGEFLVATATRVYRSMDGGLTFGELTRPPMEGSSERIMVVHVHPSVPGLIFLGTTRFLLRSTDGGLSWATVTVGPAGRGILAIGTPPAGGGTMFAVAGYRLFTSVDFGLTWSFVAVQPLPEPSAVGFVPDGAGMGSVLVVGGDGLAVAPLTAPSHWQPAGLGSGTHIGALWATPTAVVATTPGPTLWMSRDRARTWTRVAVRLASGAEPLVRSLAADRVGRLFAATFASPEGVLFASSDGGQTWQRRDNGLPGEDVAHIDVDVHHGDRLFASSASGLYRSLNGGAQWHRVASSAHVGGVESMTFDPARPGRIYATGSSVFKSDDGGTTWQRLPLHEDLYHASVAVDAARPDVIYAAYSRNPWRTQGSVLRSLDDGRTWAPFADGLPELALSIRQIVVSQSVPYLVAGDVYRLGDNDRWTRLTDLPAVNTVSAMVLDDSDRGRMYVGTDRGVFAEALRGDETIDTDGDGLPDVWESRYQLDLLDASDAALDADGDGRTALEGYRSLVDFRHPRAFHRAAFAEGIEASGFSTRYALLNADTDVATVVARFVLDSGRVVQRELEVAAGQRVFFDAESVPELLGRTFGVEFTSDRFLATERRVQWANGQGAHREVGQVPSRDWYFAEGATHSGFNVFYAVANDGDEPVEVHVRPLVWIPANTTGDPLDVIRPARLPYVLPPHSRTTIWLNDALRSTYGAVDVGAHLTASAPIVAERVMYLASATSAFGAGNVSAGARAPSTRWSVPEGATGSFFDEFVLMANPFEVPATATLTYRRADGVTATKSYLVPPFGRVTVWVDEEQADARGALFRDAVLSIQVEATQPIVVERSMWWPGPTVATWAESHVSSGVSMAHPRWLVPDAEVAGSNNAETYVLVGNPSALQQRVEVMLRIELPGVSYGVLFEADLPPGERLSVPVREAFDESVARHGLTSAVLDVRARLPNGLPGAIVVERSTYSDANGQRWRAGSSASAVPVP